MVKEKWLIALIYNVFPYHLFYLFFTISFAIFCHDSQYLAPTVVIIRYRTPRLSKILGSYFLVF